MKTMDDQYWEKAVERLDLAPGDLAEAERKLAAVEDVPVAPDEVERFVARATGVVRPRRWWIPRVAAVVLGAMMLAAAAYWLIWEEERYSSTTANRQGTMTYGMAIELLGREDQPLSARRSAMALTEGVASHGIEALRSVRDDTTADESLQSLARELFGSLARLFAMAETTRPSPFEGDPVMIARMAGTADLPLDERRRQVELLADFTAVGIRALLAAGGLDENLRAERRASLARLSAKLAR